jgi:protein-disulfide isomerase
VLSASLLAAVVAVVIAVGATTGGSGANAGFGGKLGGAALSQSIFAGVPQRGSLLGRADAPVRIVEFADLQCPYCREYTVQALPTLVRDFVRTGKVQMQFENLSFIGPDSVRAGRLAAAAGAQGKLWNFIDLVYLNQGLENTGYMTSAYLSGILDAIPGLRAPDALAASQAPATEEALREATQLAGRDGINGTPSFLIGPAHGPLRQFQPPTLTAAPFAAAIRSVLGGTR